jgi:hypothetical protein
MRLNRTLIVIFRLVLLVLLHSCDSDNALDCLQTAGPTVVQEVEVVDFDKILVNRGVELILKQSEAHKVTIETGSNLLNDIEVTVEGGQLLLTNKNTCNLVRDYGITKVHVESPNITEIRNSSQYTVSSDGLLSYPNLSLFSEDFTVSTEFTVGDFSLTLESETVEVISNNISIFYLDGAIERLLINFSAGASRFEGAELMADHVEIFHRSSNDITVNPLLSLTGELRSTGDLISLNQPPLVAVEEFYTGRLIFN